jgi:hypothetical protein
MAVALRSGTVAVEVTHSGQRATVKTISQSPRWIQRDSKTSGEPERATYEV